MFRRVLYDNWHDLVPIVAFVLTFAVFIIAFIRALLMRKDKSVRMSLLPLDDGSLHTVGQHPETPSDQSAQRKPCSGSCDGCCCKKAD